MARTRIHGGERCCDSWHKVGSSVSNHHSSSITVRTRTRRQCRSKRAANGTKHWTLEMPQALFSNCAVELRAAASLPLAVPSPQLATASSALHLLLVAAVFPPNVFTALWTNTTLTDWGGRVMGSCNRDLLLLLLFL